MRAIDKKQQAWIDSNIETFSRKMDKIYDEEAIIAKMKTIAIKDPNLIHPEKVNRYSSLLFKNFNGFRVKIRTTISKLTMELITMTLMMMMRMIFVLIYKVKKHSLILEINFPHCYLKLFVLLIKMKISEYILNLCKSFI